MKIKPISWFRILWEQQNPFRNEVAPIPNDIPPDQSRYLTYEQMNLINSYRNFTMEMAIFGRFTITCVLLYEVCVDAVYARLLQVPYESYQQMIPYLGQEKAEQYYHHIVQIIITFHDLLLAMKAGDAAKINELTKLEYQNADALADFLASTNPYWSKEQWQALFYQNLQMTISQILAIQNKEYAKSVDIFDRLRYHTILMGDYLARGMMQLLRITPPDITEPPLEVPGAPATPPTPQIQIWSNFPKS